MNNYAQAKKIATKELRQCYASYGILAGRHHFTDYWARDGFFAALGSLTIGDHHIVQKMVDFFFSHQRPDGLIPYRIVNGPITIGKYLGRPKMYPQPKPTYRLRGIGHEIFDGTTLSLILHGELMKRDLHRPQLRLKVIKAFEYLISKEKNGLLWDGVMAEWNDTAYKYGNLLYSNILYWRAASLCSQILVQQKHMSRLDQRLANSLRQRLWNHRYFADWHDYKRQDYFYPFGNLLAVAWQFTTPQETVSILDHSQQAVIDFTLHTNTPKYPFWRIDVGHHLIGMSSYQNQSTLWWQPAAVYAAALASSNHHSAARSFLTKMSSKIISDNGLYECYQPDGKPLNRLFYQAERPFAWASGMYLWASSYVS